MQSNCQSLTGTELLCPLLQAHSLDTVHEEMQALGKKNVRVSEVHQVRQRALVQVFCPMWSLLYGLCVTLTGKVEEEDLN